MALPEEPYTRVERYLARLSGQNVDIPEYPITRIECYLDYLCSIGGGVPAPNAGAHNSIFRGNSLGSSLTDAQLDAIESGSFDDIFVGDYWTIGNRVYVVAGLDLFYGIGDTTFNVHHAVMISDRALYNAQMNSENVTTGGYMGSALRTEGLASALDTLSQAFEGALLTRRSMLCSAVTNGAPSGWTWADSTVDIMTESQVLGRGSWGVQAGNGFNVGDRYSQFPLFALKPDMIRRGWIWFQDVVSASAFSGLSLYGQSQRIEASSSAGVRPYFCIGRPS